MNVRGSNIMLHRLNIVIEVLCPNINDYSDISHCANCIYCAGIEDGNILLCKCDDVSHE